MVIILDGHFDIQACELAHVSVSETVLGSEDGTNFEDSVEISHNAHLLIQLRGLGKAGFGVEVF